MNGKRLASLAAVCAVVAGCGQLQFSARALTGNIGQLFTAPRTVPDKVARPVRDDARLAALWVGHATVLLQMDDKVILTDPVFTESVGQIVQRVVEPGLDLAAVPRLDAVLISHVHFDHLSVGTLELLADRIDLLVAPSQGMVYVPNGPFEAEELPTWSSIERDGMRITAVPVEHVGSRYRGDLAWIARSFTGYVIEYHGMTVYFGGDTAYDRAMFAATRARFPRIDLALLPIGPIHPRHYMKSTHVDPAEAVQAFLDLGATRMLPIHHATFILSPDEDEAPLRALRGVMRDRGLTEREVLTLAIGEQRVLIPREEPSASRRE